MNGTMEKLYRSLVIVLLIAGQTIIGWIVFNTDRDIQTVKAQSAANGEDIREWKTRVEILTSRVQGDGDMRVQMEHGFGEVKSDMAVMKSRLDRIEVQVTKP